MSQLNLKIWWIKSHKISVELVFMLAMAQPHEQVNTLQNLIALFQDDEK